ncbi:MAG: ASKHA domain-containing protein [Vulcanimicrobiota bacterium]
MDLLANTRINERTEKYRVTFLPQEKVAEVTSNMSLLEAARQVNIPLVAECGGVGVCGSCKLKLLEGKIKSEELFVLSEEESQQGYILACSSFPTSDIVVEIPGASIPLGVQTASAPFNTIDEKKFQYEFSSLVEKYYLEMELRTVNDGLNEMDRVLKLLKLKTGTEKIDFNYNSLQQFSSLLSQAGGKITLTVSRARKNAEVIAVEEGDTTGANYGIVIDIGTTTVEGMMVEVPTGKVLLHTSFVNPQLKYGQDIISRMIFAGRDKGLLILNDIISDRINEILVQLTCETGISKEKVYSIVLSGNLVMMYLFLGFNTDSLHKDPHIPTILNFPVMNARELNLYANSRAVVYTPPALGAFVGSDLISSLIATGMPDENFFLVDIGTNGEVAAKFEDAVSCASTSAGPAFEGGGIKHGMRATSGAINRVEYSQAHNDFTIGTIGNTHPRGICGTGMVDLLSNLLLSGYIDKKGKFQRRRSTSRIRTENGTEEFVVTVSPAEEKVISITEQDIDYIIKSKGAIYTGYRFLMEQFGMKGEDLDSYYIAGALGSTLNIENGIRIGLFPDIDRNKFKYIGNGALYGGWNILLSGRARAKAEEIANKAVYFDLSNEPAYMNDYSSSLFLPHTDLELFPSVVKLFKE